KALLLPERRLRLEVVHDEGVGLVGVAAMCAGGLHHHDVFAHIDAPYPMDDLRLLQIPALAGLADDAFDLRLGDAWEVLQEQVAEVRGAGVVAHLADKTNLRAATVTQLARRGRQ